MVLQEQRSHAVGDDMIRGFRRLISGMWRFCKGIALVVTGIVTTFLTGDSGPVRGDDDQHSAKRRDHRR